MEVYSYFSPTEENLGVGRNCDICLVDFEENESGVVAHSGNGDKHPIHKSCIKLWAAKQPICPTCKTPVNGNGLFTWSERSIVELKSLEIDALKGMVVGGTVAVAAAAAVVAGAAVRGGSVGAILVGIFVTKGLRGILGLVVGVPVCAILVGGGVVREVVGIVGVGGVGGVVAAVVAGVFRRHFI